MRTRAGQVDRGDQLPVPQDGVSMGVSPGRRCKSLSRMRRSPVLPVTTTEASSAAIATAMSDGCTATQPADAPRIAW